MKTLQIYEKQKHNKKFTNTYKFCDGDINKFCLMLKKGAYSYEYMDSWQKFNKTSLQERLLQ